MDGCYLMLMARKMCIVDVHDFFLTSVGCVHKFDYTFYHCEKKANGKLGWFYFLISIHNYNIGGYTHYHQGTCWGTLNAQSFLIMWIPNIL